MQSTTRSPLGKLQCLLLIMLIISSGPALSLELTGITNSHDPSTLIRDQDTYFQFTTGNGVWFSRSTDLKHWDNPGTIFGAGWPSWISSAVPEFEGHFWAPDAIQMGDYFYVYYSVSTFGSSRSAIGVARTQSLKNPNWQDLGMVVQSHGGADEINAIDPALFRDHDGKVYMSYGSWFGGLGVAEINQTTGKLAGTVSHIYGGGHQSIEAPYITRQGDYYYLFFTRGLCCRGEDSTYEVQVVRATSVFGPYTEERNLLPNQVENRKGPGHIGVLKEQGCNYVSTHYYDLNDNGAAKLDIQLMSFVDDWPSMSSDFSSANSCGGVSDGLYRLVSQHSGKPLEIQNAATDNGGNVVQYDFFGGLHQKWYVIRQDTSTYSLINANSLKSMDVWEGSHEPGANIAQWQYWGSEGQQWRINFDGNQVEIKSKLSDLVLDVNAKSQANSANIIQWTPNGGANQRWLMIRQY